MIQVIVYSVATGRVRRVVDPEVNVPNVLAFLNQVHIAPGEARLLYNKVGGGADTLPAWQAAVNAHTGLSPDTAQADWYVGVDANNAIQSWCIADPACGDSLPGLTLVKAPWGADNRWTYDGTTFAAPVMQPGVKAVPA